MTQLVCLQRCIRVGTLQVIATGYLQCPAMLCSDFPYSIWPVHLLLYLTCSLLLHGISG